MSRLKELIEQLCPDGVEYKRLGDISEVRSGWGFPNEYQGETSGELPFYKVKDMTNKGNERIMQNANNYVSREVAEKLGCKPAPAGTVVFPKIGAAIGTNKKRVLSTESCYDNNVMGLIANDSVMSEYLALLMSGIDLMRFVSGEGAVPSIRKGTVQEYRVPVPPIEVQREIVRILDSMQELDDALSEERVLVTERVNALRAMVYGTSRYPMTRLGNIGEFERGRRFTRAEMDGAGVGCVHYGDIYTKYGFYATEPVNRLDESIGKNLRYASKGDVIVAATSENAEDVCTAMAWLGDEDVAIHDDCQRFRHEQNPLYLAMFFNSEPFARQKQRFITESKVVRIAGDEMAQIEIPLPPLEKQNEIADGMMASLELLNAIEEELRARRKQFEYYRDKLLYFPEKAVSA